MKSVLAVPLAALLVLAGCAPPEDQPEQDQSLVEQVRAARESLGDPMLRLAGALVRASELIEAVRHEIPRGEPMAEAAAAAGGEAGRLRAAAQDAAEAAADGSELDEPVSRAASIVAQAAEQASAAADAADAETDMLQRLGEIDTELGAFVSEWDTPGSQTERHETLAAQAEAALSLAEEARQVEPAPGACTRLRDNRVRWAELVAERSGRLAEAALGAAGATYDELRDAFRRAPFGEDRLAADAADATCWQAASELAGAAAAMNEHVEGLEQALTL